jgi:hypothetical protein
MKCNDHAVRGWTALSIVSSLAMQVMLQVFTFAFLVVIGCVIIMTPIMLYVFRLTVSSIADFDWPAPQL